VKIGYQKPWWTPDLDNLKQQCIDITNLWKSVGRPRNGNINAERLRCKYRYKEAIKDAAYEADKSLNDSLFNHPCTKNNDSLWKSWRKRFCFNNIKPTSGKTGDDILPEFTKFYEDVFKPNTADSDDKFRVELDGLLSAWIHSASQPVPRIDVQTLIDLICHLKRRKAASADGVVSEHIIFGGCAFMYAVQCFPVTLICAW